MAEQALLGTFAKHAFLEALSERHRMILASGAVTFTAKLGEVLAREGSTAKKFYLIQSGQVSLGIETPESGVVEVQKVGMGDVIGWSWLVPPHRWKFECRAVNQVQGIAFDAEWLREKCEQDHELGYHLLKELLAVVASRLTATRIQVQKFYK